jgi:hypothetical protein
LALGNPINSDGNVGADGLFPQACGDSYAGVEGAFVCFRKSHRYVVLGDPPGVGSANSETIGIADDSSVAVYVSSCSTKQTFVYRVTSAGTAPQSSQPCACLGYTPVGRNTDGTALNNRKLGPALLSFPNGTPKITPLATNVGPPAKARITAVGTPGGYVGTQYNPKAHKRVPTVWLGRKPYRLLVAPSSKGRPIASVWTNATWLSVCG